MDYIIKNGTIVDGTRSKPYKGTLIIKDGLIEKITEDKMDYGSGENIIDASGKIVSPGFIDIHTHSDACYLLPEKSLSKLYQGITTEITGNCGVSAIPLSEINRKAATDYYNGRLAIKLEDPLFKFSNITEFKEELNRASLPVNIGVLIGQGTLRAAIVGYDDRKATEEEIHKMCSLLDEEMKRGVLGLSLGLIYPPGSFTDTDELIELAKVVAENDGILAVHMRNESQGIFQAVDELLNIAEKSNVHLHISHLKLIGKKQWGKSDLLLDKINKAKAKGLNITCDQYPYNATSTSLSALVPRWAHDGGIEKMLERLAKPDIKLDEDILEEMENRGGASRVAISSTDGHMTQVENLNIEEASKLLDLNLADTVKEILIKAKGNVAAVYYSLDLDDVLNIMKEMYISVGSDGSGYNLDPKITLTNPHPRNFGTFPKFLEMIRENNLMPIEDAVYKMTKLTADTLGITHRGTLLPGQIADITVFDLEKTKDKSEFLKSVVKPEGIEHVFIAGKPALLNGEEKIVNNGRVIIKNNPLQ